MKTLYILACGLLLCAVFLDIAGKTQHSSAARYLARSLNMPHAEQEQALHYSKSTRALGDRLMIGGIVAAASGMALWITSVFIGRLKGKRMTPVLPLVLLAAYAYFYIICV